MHKTAALTLLLCASTGLFAASAGAGQSYDLLVGTYTGGASQGLYRYRFDSASGRIETPALQVVPAENPSWLVLNPEQTRLYVVNENGPGAPDPQGKASAFAIAPGSHELSLIDQVQTRGDEPTHASLAPGGKHLFVANYAVHADPGGSLAVLGVGANGELTEVLQQERHAASHVNPQRQAGSHVHSVVSGADGQHVYVQDLGADKVFIYRYVATDSDQPLSAEHPESVQLPPGSGPRHLLFSGDGRFAYLTLEMAGQIAVFAVNDGQLEQRQLVDLAAGRDAAHKAAAGLHLSADGRFLYASNRGASSELLVFAVDPASGLLKEVQRRASEGVEPREFSLDPSGHFLLVANQKSNEIRVMRRDPASGKLGETLQTFSIDSPSDLKFLR
ncbi:lactonase family protein [Pseudomonas citronellolis]|uniref:lactonase family protein n=1 Tax=Pseudomonas citronellolis TaxID=53408 RepID=UPI0023E416CE|nr:lactonase family protein [Pseudomonas citronellolis]MDF3937063.1 lactonase family protein [Pseudomonas citronellolis]